MVLFVSGKIGVEVKDGYFTWNSGDFREDFLNGYVSLMTFRWDF